jgi:hypothetical protein
MSNLQSLRAQRKLLRSERSQISEEIEAYNYKLRIIHHLPMTKRFYLHHEYTQRIRELSKLKAQLTQRIRELQIIDPPSSD